VTASLSKKKKKVKVESIEEFEEALEQVCQHIGNCQQGGTFAVRKIPENSEKFAFSEI
jgi:hypothetical protein